MLLDARISGRWTYGLGSGWGRTDRPGVVSVTIREIITPERHDQLRTALAASSSGPRTADDGFYLLRKACSSAPAGQNMHGLGRRDRGIRQYR